VLNTALPFITKDLHYHKDGVLSSAVVLGAAAGAITAGKLADVLGPRHAQVRSLGRGPGSQIWGRHAQVRAGGGGGGIGCQGFGLIGSSCACIWDAAHSTRTSLLCLRLGCWHGTRDMSCRAI
jgi:MFS family permease